MRAVSDSSVLIVYARSGLIDLLDQVFDEVLAPAAVHDEVTQVRQETADAHIIAGLSWLRRIEVDRAAITTRFPSWFGRGESEVLLTAMMASEPVTLLLDDGGARRIARGLGFDVLGSGGVLVLAKRQGVIEEVRPLLDRLVASGLYLSQHHANQILAAANE